MLLRLLVTLCLVSLPIASRAADAAEAASRFRQAHRAVVAHVVAGDIALDPSPAAIAALQAQWAAARNLVAALLDREPGIAPAALARAAHRTAGLELYGLRLDRGALLVSAKSGEIGTAFIMRRDAGGRHRPLLSFDALPTANDLRMPELAAWQPAHAASDCGSRRPERDQSQCGPVAADRLIPLPNEKDGARRFAVLAYYGAGAGGTGREQISIWRWDGRIATPLLTRTFFQMILLPAFAARDVHGFTLHAKEDYISLQACDGCEGRQMIWRFDLPSTGVAPPRIRPLSPELDLIDLFYTRLFAHRPAADLAAPAVIARLRHVELDMIDHWRYAGHSRGARLLCLDALGFDRPQIFRIVRSRGRLWIADVTFARPHACDDPHAHI